MQRRRIIAPLLARTNRRNASLRRRTRFNIGRLYRPESPGVLVVFIKGYCEQAAGGRIFGVLDIGGRIMQARQARLTNSLGEIRISMPDQAEKYDTASLILWPEPNKTFIITSGVLVTPDPKYVWQILHKFTTAEDQQVFANMKATEFERPIYEDEVDADNTYANSSGRVSDEGAITEDLIDVTNVDDGTGARRTIQKRKIAVE